MTSVMHAGPTYYCWHCYATGEQASGPCPVCGQPVEGPAGLDYVDRLLWSLHHPLPERRISAAQVLGARREHRAAEPLRIVLAEGADPHLAIAALTALVRISGVAANRELLEDYAHYGPAPTRRTAQNLLRQPPRG